MTSLADELAFQKVMHGKGRKRKVRDAAAPTAATPQFKWKQVRKR